MAQKIIVGISGASGSHLAFRLMQTLKALDVETFLIATDSAKQTWESEMKIPFEKLENLADHVLNNSDIGACCASGSFQNDGMIIVPCSMKTIGGIAHGYSENLLLRSADVMIKEKRKLVLCFRENPLSPIHLQNLHTLSLISDIYLMPMMMTYYHQPQTIEEMEDCLIGKLLSPFNIEYQNYKRWK